MLEPIVVDLRFYYFKIRIHLQLLLYYKIFFRNNSNCLVDFQQGGRILHCTHKKRVQWHLWAESHGSHVSALQCSPWVLLYLRSDLVLQYIWILFSWSLCLGTQNCKRHFASLWPFSKQMFSHFEILATIVFWHTENWFRSPAEKRIYSSSHAIPKPVPQPRDDDQGQQWACGCQPGRSD